MKSLATLFRRLALAAALASAAAPAAAGVDLVGHDTDLFTTNPSIPAQVPNVLLLFDNTANFSNNANAWADLADATCLAAFVPRDTNNKLNTQGDAQLCALYKVLTNLDEQINVGLMEFNDQVKGGYVRFPMASMTATNKAALQTILKNIATVSQGVNTPAEKASQNSDYDGPFSDAWRYFNSFTTFTGVASDVSSKADASAYRASKTAFQFTSGTNSTSCGTDYIILMGNTFPKAGPSITTTLSNAKTELADDSVQLDTSVLNSLGSQARYADNWAKFMFYYGVKIAAGVYRPITTYTIDVCNAACDADQAILLKSIANVSHGKYIKATSLTDIETALKTVFAEVQAVNSVFAATTLPVSINVRGTNLNQVYIGVFRPDSQLSPRWLGNLKHYKLGVVANSTTGQLELIDAEDVTAVNLNTGFISNTATSFWTQKEGTSASATDGFWGFRVVYANTDVGKDEDLPDGDLVEKGGAAQKIRQYFKFPDSGQTNADGTSMTRNVYTCTGTCSSTAPNNSLKDYLFNAANTTGVTDSLLGTLATTAVTSITGTGTTAKVTIAGGHTFANPQQVVIAGASPSYYNTPSGATVLTSPAPTATEFYYTVTPSPNATVDTDHAYATYTTTVAPSNALVTGTDLVTVTSSTPTNYNVAATATTAVSGASNQFSYPITSTSTPSSGYAVTALRKLSSLTWTNGVVTATTTGTNHGYAATDQVNLSSVSDATFNNNGPYTITEIPTGSTNTFKFNLATVPAGVNATTGVVVLNGAVPTAWGSTPTVRVCLPSSSTFSSAATSCSTSTGVTATVCSTGTSCTGVSPSGSPALGTYFTYTTNATVSGTGTLTGATVERLTADTSTYVPKVSGAELVGTTVSGRFTITDTEITGSGASERMTITLSQARLNAAGDTLRKLAVGDPFTITGTCTVDSPAVNCSTLAITTITPSNFDTSVLVGTPSTTAQNFSGNATVVIGLGPQGNRANNTDTFSSGATLNYGSTGTGVTTNTALKLTLGTAKYSAQQLLQFVNGENITIKNCSITVSGAQQACGNSGSIASGTANNITIGTGTAAFATDPGTNTFGTLTDQTNVTVTFSPPNIGLATAVSTATAMELEKSGTTASTALNSTTGTLRISSVETGPQSVTLTNTGYAAKTGDLTSKVVSITSQGTATGNITVGLVGSTSLINEREDLIAWVRGMDNKNSENEGTLSTDIRASVHGDVLHSRPAVVNYNRNGDDDDVYIFYGTNDGMLRAVKGGTRTTSPNGHINDGGREQWTFIPPEFFGKLKRLRDQSPVISSSNPREYGFDGPIAIYTRDANQDNKINSGDGDKVYLFLSMRRGGRMMYALDVSDPLDPKLLWKKGCTQATGNGNTSTTGGCDVGFEQMGQTWSEPKLGYLRKWPSTLALMFAAGNDSPAEIPQPCFISAWDDSSVTYRANAVVPTPMSTTNCTTVTSGTVATVQRTMGRGIYILNAETGAILWRAGPEAGATYQVPEMTYAMPGDLAVMKNRSNTGARATSFGTESVTSGYMDRIYAADTGGNVWRFDVADASGTALQAPTFVISRLAKIAQSPILGLHPALHYRKFLFNPDVVYSTDHDAVLIGSGDREHPFDQIVQNKFYMFKDKNIGTLVPADVNTTSTDMTVKYGTTAVPVILDTTSSTQLYDVTSNCLQTCTGTALATAKTDLAAAKGWKLSLTTTGEKVVAPATTAAGSVIFNTNEPKQDAVTGTAAACTSDLGTARQYGISYTDATATYIFGTVTTQYVPSGGRYSIFAGGGFLPQPVPVVVQIDGKYYQTVIAGVQTTNPGGLKLQSRVRTYWFRKVD